MNKLVRDPDADKFAKEDEERRKKEEEEEKKEKEKTERGEREKKKFLARMRKVLIYEPGLNKIERIYTKKNNDDEDEDWLELSWNPYPDGRRENNANESKRWFGEYMNQDPELRVFLLKLYAKYNATQKQEEERIEKAEFSNKRLVDRIWGTFKEIFNKVFPILIGVLAASLAINLNLYKNWPYRVLYGIFAYNFWYIVLPYVYLYRWAWLGKKPKFYSLLPLIPLRFENRLIAQFYSWLSYKPDDEIHSQLEWLTWVKEQEKS